jgi:prophage tail gpP-like protein
MGAKNRGTVSMRFSDGTVFQAWDEVSLRDTYVDPLGDLSFVAKPLRRDLKTYREHLRKGELVAVLINDAPQGVQLIQTVDTTVDREGGVTFNVSCNTPLITAVEGSANPDYAFSSKSATFLTSIIGDLLRPYGFGEVYAEAEDDVNVRAGGKSVKGKTKVNRSTLKAKDLQVHEGEAAYGVATRLCNDAGVCLRCDVEGRLILGHPRYDQPVSNTVVQDFDGRTKGDRMLHVDVHDTNDGQFSECVVRGASHDDNDQTYAARPQARYVVASSKTATDAFPVKVPFNKVTATTFPDARHTYRSAATVAPYKPRILRDKMGGDASKCLGVAKLVIGMRASKAFVVTCEVDGWISQTGRVWTVDTVGRVVIEAIELDAEMWLLERTLMMSRSGAQKTRLRWIPKDSLQLGNIPE